MYAKVQERTTFFHYQAVRTRIRREYGLPPAPNRPRYGERVTRSNVETPNSMIRSINLAMWRKGETNTTFKERKRA